MGQQPKLIVELRLHRHNAHKTWCDIAKHAGQVTDSQPRNGVSASPPPLPKAEPRPTAEAEVRSTPDQTRADRPILKPKATTVTTEDALRPLPTLRRRPTPEATCTPKHKASPLRFRSRPGNERPSIAALLASIDQGVEAVARSLAPTAAARRDDGAPTATIEALQDQIRRHGDRCDASS
jgi:type IV secretion system protein VirD4